MAGSQLYLSVLCNTIKHHNADDATVTTVPFSVPASSFVATAVLLSLRVTDKAELSQQEMDARSGNEKIGSSSKLDIIFAVRDNVATLQKKLQTANTENVTNAVFMGVII